MRARKKPAKPPPRAAKLICPGQDFHSCEPALQPVLPELQSTDAFARDLRSFDEACARAYWLALWRD